MNSENEPRLSEFEELDSVNKENKDTTTKRPIGVIILAVFGVVAVLAALGIGIFQLADKSKNGLSENLSSLGSNISNLFQGKERLVVNTSSLTIASGEKTTLSVEHKNKRANTSGDYFITISCAEGVEIELDGKEVTCDKETLLTATEDPELTVTSLKSRYVDIEITARFESEDAKQDLSSDLLLTVVNRKIASELTDDKKDQTEDKETPKTEEKPKEEEKKPEERAPEFITVERRGSRYSYPDGTPDLAVTINDIGYLDRNGKFVSSNSVTRDDRIAVRFTVSNLGNKETGNWYFSALVPVEGDSYHRSGKQPSLQPGDKMVFTLGFDNIDYRGEGKFYLNIDPLGEIKEVSELNNFAQAQFRVRR